MDVFNLFLYVPYPVFPLPAMMCYGVVCTLPNGAHVGIVSLTVHLYSRILQLSRSDALHLVRRRLRRDRTLRHLRAAAEAAPARLPLQVHRGVSTHWRV